MVPLSYGVHEMEKFYTPDIETKEGFLEIKGALKWGRYSEDRYTLEVTEKSIFDGMGFWYFGKDAFRSPEEAAAKARELRERKVPSLKKEIASLESFGY